MLPLAKLCRTGGIVNAYNAILLAEKAEQQKKSIQKSRQ
jgi:hypothetical protein